MVIPLVERLVANEHESRTLAATRDLLLPKLLSGEIRIRTPRSSWKTSHDPRPHGLQIGKRWPCSTPSPIRIRKGIKAPMPPATSSAPAGRGRWRSWSKSRKRPRSTSGVSALSRTAGSGGRAEDAATLRAEGRQVRPSQRVDDDDAVGRGRSGHLQARHAGERPGGPRCAARRLARLLRIGFSKSAFL